MAKLKIKPLKSNSGLEKTADRSLQFALRPMTLQDMVAGYEYVPGMSILHVQTPPVFGKETNEALIYLVPVWLPEQYRASTEFNIHLALELVKKHDREAAECIQRLSAISRSRRPFAHLDELRRASLNPHLIAQSNSLAPRTGSIN